MPPLTFDDISTSDPSPKEIAHFKQALGVPDGLNVQISVSDRYYWPAGAQRLIQIFFTRGGKTVAAVAFDTDTLEIVRDILIYAGDADGPSAWAAAKVAAAHGNSLIPKELDAD